MNFYLFYKGGDFMKKLLVALSLGAVLVAGFTFTQDSPSDLSMDREPGILSIQKTNLF